MKALLCEHHGPAEELVDIDRGLDAAGIAMVPLADGERLDDRNPDVEPVAHEDNDVGAALGYPLLPIFGLSAEDVSRPETVVDTLLDTLYTAFVIPGATTTVLQDWTKGRHSEVDDINGAVVAGGAAQEVATPVNTAVVDVAHRIERGELVPGTASIALLQELAGG